MQVLKGEGGGRVRKGRSWEVVRERGLEREGREVMQKSTRLILIGH